MATVWRKPNRRDTSVEQVEICALCGRLVGAADRFMSLVEGLRGQFVCRDHGDIPITPSVIDLGWPGNAPIPNRELQPPSGSDWIGIEDGDWPT